MGPRSYMRSVVNRNVFMPRILVSVFHDVLKIGSKSLVKMYYRSIVYINFKYCRQRCMHDLAAGNWSKETTWKTYAQMEV
jgi:hypothetical protein